MENTLLTIRRDFLAKIKALMLKCGVTFPENGVTVIECTDISETESVVVMAHPDDDNLTFTLDRIILDDAGLHFEASNSCANTAFHEIDIPTDSLLSIYDYLVAHEDSLDKEGGTSVRILVTRAGDPAADVISVNESIIEDEFGGDISTFLDAVYGKASWEHATAGTVKGIPVRQMVYTEDDTPDKFLVKHYDDKRIFI